MVKCIFFNPNNGQLFYSWYEGQLINGSTYCDVWWINLSQGIPANSNVTISMYIGLNSANYYSQYYPYVGASPQVISGYDNGNYTFIAYGYFYATYDGWSVYIYSGSPYTYIGPTTCGISLTCSLSGVTCSFYALPPNNWNIPKIPLIVEKAWYFYPYNSILGYTYGGPLISLFGNTSNQISGPTSNLSTYAYFNYYYWSPVVDLESAVTNSVLNSTGFLSQATSVYGYLIVNSTYAQTGYYIYAYSGPVWVPLTLLDMYPLSYNPNYGNYTYSTLNYNPFQYPTLELSGIESTTQSSYETFNPGTDLCIEWVVARAYPPNGIMPSIFIQHLPDSISSVQLSPLSSSIVCPGTQTLTTVTANLNNPLALPTTVIFSCSTPSGITCSFNPSSCTTNGSSCSTTLYVNSSLTIPPGSYSVTVEAVTSGSSASTTYTYNIGPNISISSQSSSNFQNSYSIYITGCAQNYTLYVNNSPYCYDSYYQFQNINSLCTVSYPGSYSVYAQGCYNGTCVNSNTINLNIPSSGGITVPIIDINILNITSQNINTTISVNGVNQNIQSINVYYNNNNVYSNNSVNTNYYSFNLQLPYSNS